MPIVSREIEVATVKRDGRVRVREVLTDRVGRRHVFEGAKYRDLAAANTRMNARSMTRPLKALDARDFRIHVEETDNTAGFSFTDRDLTFREAEPQLFKEFAQGGGGEATKLVTWIAGLSETEFDRLRAAAGFDAAAGVRIEARRDALLQSKDIYDEPER